MILGNQPAFPFIDDKENIREDGMSIRTYIATHAFIARLNNICIDNILSEDDAETVAIEAVLAADKLISILNQPKTEAP